MQRVLQVQQYFWDTPSNLLEAHNSERIWLTPPQAYELKRLSYLQDIEQVVSFARNKRFANGTTPLCPVAFTAAEWDRFGFAGKQPLSYKL
ncbi:nucleoside diphosphate-linked moiety X motif 19-like [Anopheles stephensi]|uniref:nucleoside diphosphate-linked moiety X motif 19-like n=1 Tax=Anopheles stephensi TaxID=30069 RepID=UPI001658AF6D|nr:nucleoside diphosphate-linked moiety X motif 19-like [Anopheles stephensi]